MVQEFKEFALKGNVVDLAVAVMLGNAINAIVSSLVNDIVMPLIGILLGGKDFSTLSITIGKASIQYGAFIQAVINFFVIAICLFLAVKAINAVNAKMKSLADSKEKDAKAEDAPEVSPTEEYLKEIRDLLQQQSQDKKS